MIRYYALLLFFAFYVNAQSQTVYKLDNSTQYTWDMGTTSWVIAGQDLYTYANGGIKETNKLTQFNNAGSWEDTKQVNSVYNASNNLTIASTQTWNMGTMMWTNISRTEHDYDANQNIIETRIYSLIVSPNLDAVFIQTNFQYNASNLVTEQIMKVYDVFTMQLVNSSRITTAYNGDLPDEQIIQTWNTISNMWDNTTKINYFYDGNNQLIRAEERPWEATDWATNPNRQTLYTYNGSMELTEIITQEWVAAAWVNQFRAVNTYNSGALSIVLSQEWNTKTAAWDTLSQATYTYDGNGNLTETINQIESGGGGSRRALENSSRITYNWSEATNLSASFEDVFDASIYPNPFKSEITVNLETPLISSGNLVLYDINGKQIAQKTITKGDFEFRFELPQISQGTYFLKLITNDIQDTYKIIKN